MEQQTNHVTIKLVAERANVSVATAARVMGNYGYVSQKTRDRVMRAAQELSYVPDAIAKSMRRRRTDTIGILIGDVQAPFFSQLVFYVENVIYAHGYSLLICNTNEQPDRELKYIRSLFERRVDGIIVCSAHRNDSEISPELKGYYESDLPIVMVDRKLEGVNCPLVISDNFDGSYRATKHLLDQGHRKIGVIAASRYINSIMDRAKGFYQAMRDSGIEPDEDMIRFCEESYMPEACRAVAQDFIRSHPDVTALYLLNQQIAKSTWITLKSMGIRVPDDISVLGWGDSEFAEAWDMTVMFQSVEEIATCAANLLLDLIHGRRKKEFQEITFDTRLVHRSSCAQVSAGKAGEKTPH